MTYTIVEALQEEQTITTRVQFTFDDGTTSTVSIAHFMPKSLLEIAGGIKNRAQSELVRLNAQRICQTLLPQIALNTIMTV